MQAFLRLRRISRRCTAKNRSRKRQEGARRLLRDIPGRVYVFPAVPVRRAASWVSPQSRWRSLFPIRQEDHARQAGCSIVRALGDSAGPLAPSGIKCLSASAEPQIGKLSPQLWVAVDLVKPPKARRLPDIVTVEEAGQLFATTRILSYRVFYFTLYSLGLRLGEGLRLQLGDIDAERARVHVRDSKGNKDRFVPLPTATLAVLRRFWQTHRNPVLLFPSRQGSLKAAARATSPLDRGGVQLTLRKVAAQCGLKKRSRPTACATATPLT